jgi:hypothetical protein
VLDKLVGSGAKLRKPGEPSILRAIDHGLRVLDPDTDRKRLGLDEDSGSMDHRKRFTGAVTDRQHKVAGLDGVAIGQTNTANLAVCIQEHRIHAGLKVNLTAQSNDLLPQMPHHFDQAVCANVRAGLEQDVFGCASGNEFV